MRWSLSSLLTLLMFISILAISVGFSEVTSQIIITNAGAIGNDIFANTGSAKDIQTAINWVVARGGIGKVYLPAGNFNFVNVGDPWKTVNIPAGVSLFGAPTQRDSAGQVVSWNTTLIMPYDVPGDWSSAPSWFTLVGSGDKSRPSRISDIKLVGYRSINPSSTTLHVGISVTSVMNFRIDHVMFEHCCGGGIGIGGLKCNGVIDHCKLVNVYGFDNLVDYASGNIGYGISGPSRAYTGVTFDPTMSVLGKYTDYTVFIEDSYFSKWRHCVSSDHGGYYVFRYCVVDQDFGHYSLDVHGLRDTEAGRAGGRGAEIYENIFTNLSEHTFEGLFQDGGGCGVWFNNYVDTTYASSGIQLYQEDYVASDTWHLKDFYLWSKKGPWNPANPAAGFTADRNVFCDWNRQAGNSTDSNYPNVDSSWAIAGYKPYTYPHPLTLG